MTMVVYDFVILRDDPDNLIDGSDELLPEADRVTEADQAHELTGALRRIQVRGQRRAEFV